MLTLAAPLWLLLLPLPWLLWWNRRQDGTSQGDAALLHPQAALLSRLQAEINPAAQRPPWLLLLGCGLLVLALARPQWLDTSQPGRNFMLALDVSGSMRALDFNINNQQLSRLEILKAVVNRFLSERERDRVGVVLFADDAYTLVPMTTDLSLIQRMLPNVDNGIVGEKTALGDAVALGVKRLQAQDKSSRILILLTDGSHTSGQTSPAAALAMAKHEGVRIYAVGIGSHGKVLFPRGPVQEPDYKEVPMDEATLQLLADESGGRYYRATAGAELFDILDDIEILERVEIEAAADQRSEWFALPLLLGTLLVIGGRLLQQREVAP